MKRSLAAAGRRAFLARTVGIEPRVPASEVLVRVARIDLSGCLAAAAQDCARCVDACPVGEAAIRMSAGGPEVGQGCDGCGRCVRACALVNQPVSIRIVSTFRPSRPAPTEELPWQ